MITSKFIASLIVVLAIVLMWTHFCRQTGSSLEQARMNQANIMFPGCCLRIYSGHLQMGKHLLFQFVIFISYIVVVSGCFYKLLTHNRSKYKVINGHDSRHFFQWQSLTVMSLDDYFRDRLNNNLGMHELMKYEWARYESFKLYPLTAPLSPLKLAHAGFYYTGENQTVKCFCCDEQFDANDYEALNEAHQRNLRNCSFARGEGSSNIPIKHSSRSDDINCGSSENQNMIPCRHPDYVTEESRRRSFRTWPHGNIIQMQQIAEAGFFFIGIKDCVRCYSCGIGLRDWWDEDDPWVVHTRHSPNCQHVRQQRPASIRPFLNESDINHRQETMSSDQISHDMRTNSAQTLLYLGFTEDRIVDAFNYLRRSGIKEITPNDLIGYIQTTEPNLYNRDSPSYTMLCTNMNALNNSVDQNESSQTESAQENERQTDTNALPNRLKCKVCLDKEMCIAFLPCGHLVTCEDCAHSLQRCAICRAVIKRTVRTYLA